MNYEKLYFRIIERAKGRVISGYVERHHILPRCLGGTDESHNIVVLTGEEHYVVHQLLTRLYTDHFGLAYAAMAMAKQATGNKAYGWLRRKAIDLSRGRVRSDLHRENLSKSMSGKTHSEKTRDQISRARSGKTYRPHSEETKAKIAAALLGKKHSAERRLNQSKAAKARVR